MLLSNNDTQHKDTHFNDILHDTQHNDTKSYNLQDNYTFLIDKY